MRQHWMIAALLTGGLALGCSQPRPEAPPAQDVDEPPSAAEVSEPADAPSLPVAAAEQPPPPAPAPARPQTQASRPPAQASAPPAQTASAPPTAALTPAQPTAPVPPPPVYQEVTVATGTVLNLELLTALSSETSTVETPIRARLREAVVVDGHTALPAGAVLTGVVTEAARSGRVQGRARLGIAFNQVELSEGREQLRTTPITFEADGTTREDAARVGVGAVGGAIIGGILGGGSGAARGAAIGGAAGTGVVLATRGREVELAEGTELAISVVEPLEVRVLVR
jgi:hypothetical protein